MRRISRSKLAELAGVSRPAVTKQCDGKLKAACSGDGVDVDHPLVIEFLKRHGKAPMPTAGKPRASVAPPAAAAPSVPAGSDRPPSRTPKLKVSPTAAPTDPPKRGRGRPRDPTDDRPPNVGHMKPRAGVDEGSDQDLQDLSDAIYPLIDRFGTDFQFSSWLGSLKDIELIREKRLKNGETEGGLISRELVKNFVFGALEAANKRLLGDASKAIVSKVMSIARSGGSAEEAQRVARDEISKQLKPIKDRAARSLRHKTDGTA